MHALLSPLALALVSSSSPLSRRELVAATGLATGFCPMPAISAPAELAETAALRLAVGFAVQSDSTRALAPRVKRLSSASALAKSLGARSKRAVFLGEHHNAAADHELQAGIIRQLHSSGRREMAVGLEAVQRQFQPSLDAYVAGEIDEAEL